MLGYIVPAKGELKMREFEIYNAYYCAVCRAIKERYGELPRLMLSYDSAFLALLFTAMENAEDTITEFRCGVHPWRKKNLHVGGAAVDYAADMLVLLAYHHLEDDKRDEHAVRGYAGTLLLRRAYRRSATRLPEKAGVVRARLDDLARIEASAGDPSSKSLDIDAVSEPFAKLMEEMMDGPNFDAARSRILRVMGYNLGKWIYLIDAADDLEKDRKSGTFNPLKPGACPAERLKFTLEMCLSETAKAFELLKLYKNEAILRNIIYVGLRQKTDGILDKYAKIINGEEILVETDSGNR
jgi:hypothetical protein